MPLSEDRVRTLPDSAIMKSGSGRRNRASGIVFLESGLSDRVKYKPLKKKAHLACLALRHLAILMFSRFL